MTIWTELLNEWLKVVKFKPATTELEPEKLIPEYVTLEHNTWSCIEREKTGHSWTWKLELHF